MENLGLLSKRYQAIVSNLGLNDKDITLTVELCFSISMKGRLDGGIDK